ncbi:MAG TPA: hypothetical protein VMI31_17625 [Fimbriimonadaceae bacterium]|nr:hypothetical protein [Fimbriimonadaceae bacterium]
MSRTFILFSVHDRKEVCFDVAKDVEVGMLIARRRRGEPLVLVRIEEFDTMREAASRLAALRKMNKARRSRVVERGNPEWKPIRVDARWPVTPTGDPAPGTGESPGKAGPAGGVPARVRPPIGPRVGRDAKSPPPPDLTD